MRRALAIFLLPVTLSAVGMAQAPAVPELTTLLGRTVFARPDTDGAIAKADTALAADSRNVELVLAAARARDVALQFHAAIEVYTRALAIAPTDVRLLRFRGHRYISIRRFDLAVADLQKAVANGDMDRACMLLKLIADEPNWNAFGVIAAEADLAQGGVCR